ncbi:hypothetical protein COCCADRAFT_106211 [Bipolaris zeicola 26-R-13]|uniref:Uncharacterized protein n=1 Tax=Cochliobolus carbonum (strain 26-R-13) TaxID=930089 RepID=W6YEF0_COCC2|nr:uncharacterized protein COCCADRAFT_106211 [Bipolaris zeicola 26-R-13]EUC29561.1 hypothetical protein COCCADRAFT_106211 [Bipolaris zeicola 26-R-13]
MGVGRGCVCGPIDDALSEREGRARQSEGSGRRHCCDGIGRVPNSHSHKADETASGNAKLMHTPGATPFLLISPTPLSPLGPCPHHYTLCQSTELTDILGLCNLSTSINTLRPHFPWLLSIQSSRQPLYQLYQTLTHHHQTHTMAATLCNDIMAPQNLPPCPGPPPTGPLPAIPTKKN